MQSPIVICNWLRAHLSAVVLILLIAIVDFAAAIVTPWSWVLAVTAATVILVLWWGLILVVLPSLIWRLISWPRRLKWAQFWHWRRTVFGYHCTCSNRVFLRYDPASLKKHDVARIVSKVESCLTELEDWHGFRLRGRVCVFVLPTVEHIQAIFGTRYGALAWPAARAIIIPAVGRIGENLRHELSHLFTAQWSANGLPVLNEGMATWWEHGGDDSLIDSWASYYMGRTRLEINGLLDPQRFYERKSLHPAYCLAAGFTAYLLRRYGKELYRDFYRRATFRSFHRRFHEFFGLTLVEAEARWRMELCTTHVLRQHLERALCA